MIHTRGDTGHCGDDSSDMDFYYNSITPSIMFKRSATAIARYSALGCTHNMHDIYRDYVLSVPIPFPLL